MSYVQIKVCSVKLLLKVDFRIVTNKNDQQFVTFEKP